MLTVKLTTTITTPTTRNSKKKKELMNENNIYKFRDSFTLQHKWIQKGKIQIKWRAELIKGK